MKMQELPDDFRDLLVEFVDAGVRFQLGVPPMRIDILTRIGGIAFKDAWDKRTQLEVEGRQIPVIGIDALITNKKFVGRPQDQVDAQMLEEARSRET